ncbi:hypothetical protein SOM61_07995 [Massilia sp. CFBP9012]|uniref:Uncharacterized protein n=1 Tax=Massilia aurea TaxID=373040 RepID=A0A422QFX3_9BURK|nr:MULTISPECIES: hypothetical protein [Massilia]MDY0974901.1 hypothetical protein [Massilia sp. CFBP9012]RNF28864.1 hypothetical protein NM04_20875 [Massilia aurea]
MKNVHPEFSFQSRELEGQIEGTLGDPPNRKNYDMMVGALVSEYADGGGIDDVNMMAFALVDKIRFLDPKGLMREAADYADGDPARVFAMAECNGDDGKAMYEGMTANYPELARQAIITAFLFKNQNRWDDEDQSLEQLGRNDDGDDVDDNGDATDDFTGLFDEGDRDER